MPGLKPSAWSARSPRARRSRPSGRSAPMTSYATDPAAAGPPTTRRPSSPSPTPISRPLASVSRWRRVASRHRARSPSTPPSPGSCATCTRARARRWPLEHRSSNLVRLDVVWVRVPVYVGESGDIDPRAPARVVNLGEAGSAEGTLSNQWRPLPLLMPQPRPSTCTSRSRTNASPSGPASASACG